MDEIISYECRVFDNGHILEYDKEQSNPHKTIFSCACGFSEVVHEDAGTGA